MEGSDTKHSGAYTREFVEGIMQGLGNADLSSAHLTISHAADYIWDKLAAATPGQPFWETYEATLKSWTSLRCHGRLPG